MLKKKKKKNYKRILISLASPNSILKQSYGEILNSETINYKTQKPEPNGLFCEKIFGPIKDYECSCGKYKNLKYKGIFCDRCGIEITKKSVRRERFGHIKLTVPIVHIWAFRCLPNKISYLIGKNSREIESIIYYEKYIVLKIWKKINIKINNKYLKLYDLINEDIYLKIKNKIFKYKKNFIIKTGGEAIYYLLKNINLKKTYENLKQEIYKEKYKPKKSELLKRIQVVELFLKGEQVNKPEYMVITVLPVIPPDLRPLVRLEGGKYASSDLNEFYRKIIIRNNRLKKLIKIKAPEVILINEKRMLQESVDSLLDNSRRINSVKTDNNRVLKSLSDTLKGKLGRFRQNLLGKRVDYSARSVIVVEPNLKLYECGLPREIALELYKPFLINKLLNLGIVITIKSAKKLIKKKKKFIWEILNEIIKGHPILLNRAPTLHRFSIQAFQPILIKGKAIKLHPLVCSAFNADFDGDQMAVHLPLSMESILEAQLLMLSSQNILNISNGNPIIIPAQDIILGLYYLTIMKKNNNINPQKIKVFSSINEIYIANSLNHVKIHDKINLKYKNKIIKTTIGRALFNNIIPKYKKFKFVNKLINKNTIKNIILKVLHKTDIITTTKFLDKLKKLGLYYAFKGGISFNIKDIITPKNKKEVINLTKKKVNQIYKHYNMGFITNKDKYNQIIDIWSNTTSKISDLVVKKIKEKDFNSIYMMLDSEARSSIVQIRQLSGLRGLIAKPQKYNMSITSSTNINDNDSNEIIENPIISNFLEGLSVLEYFISTHGARKGLADTALKTADAGYLTRRLVDVVHNVIIKEKDCNTLNGIKIDNKKYKLSTGDILGRVLLLNILKKEKILIKKGTIINKTIIKRINKNKINYITIRSPLTCESKSGICSKCYGTNLSNGKLVEKGETVGVLAAQSIGEPGTQLTLRTFHFGGSASNLSKDTEIISKNKGQILYKNLKYINKNKKYIVVSRFTKFFIIRKNKIIYKKNIPYGSILYFKNNDHINKGDIIYKWDPYNAVLISEYSGIIKYNNFKKNINYKIIIDKTTGYKEIIILENQNVIPSLIIINNLGEKIKEYNLPIGSSLNVEDNEKINKGHILIKIPRKYSQTKDITGGLPRLSELFEAREPYNIAKISEIDGIISIKKLNLSSFEILIKSFKLKKKIKYKIKTYKQLLIQDNDYVKHGKQLTDGFISLNDILYIKGIRYFQKYLIKKIQEVYKAQGVEINNKHFEIVIKQMMTKVKIIERGDTNLIEGNIIDEKDFFKVNKKIKNLVIIKEDCYKFKKGQLVNKYKLKIKNEYLKIQNKKKIKNSKVKPAIAKPILLGITKSALYNKSFISAASFQETTRILSESAISAKTDNLEGLKENVIIGNKIPAGTGFKIYEKIKIKSNKKYF
ncbi:MAG: DNA-directed RNA polymerase subunit beta' [Candidatus Shikimatogenerans bostrichidophilus]|nr:MAG: DNA-directed RNA polymerase subunit beta' [Candidatus Shikimatogenerans bostrichidophilus]